MSDTDDNDVEEFDEWEEFRYDDQDAISLSELRALTLPAMPEDIRITVMDNYFPETTLSREGSTLVCQIKDLMYTKYWRTNSQHTLSPKRWRGPSAD